MPMDEASWINADWPAPTHIKAGTTTRIGGVSQSPFDSLNFGLHVEDNPEHVAVNRQRLREYLNLPSEPNWLDQVHGCTIANDQNYQPGQSKQADASMTRTIGSVCAVMTADCLPALITDKDGTCVAAVHAGWRGLAQGIVLKTVDAMSIPKQDLLVWLGPAIGPKQFEVGPEVREQFINQNRLHAKAFITGQRSDKWYMDIYQIARQQLKDHGLEQIYGGELCTFEDAKRFYSYRRDGKTGRMVSLIWMESQA